MERRPLATQGTQGEEEERVAEMTLRVVAGAFCSWTGIRSQVFRRGLCWKETFLAVDKAHGGFRRNVVRARFCLPVPVPKVRYERALVYDILVLTLKSATAFLQGTVVENTIVFRFER